MDDDFGPIIGICVVIAPVIIYLAYALYFRIQARMHEFMLTLVVSTMPVGLFLSWARDSQEKTNVQFAKAIVLGMFPAMLLFGGSIWALSAAQRIKVERTLMRLGMMLVGWLIIPSAIFAIIALFGLLFVERMDWIFLAAVLGIAPIPLYLAYRIERACPKADDSRSH